MRVGHHLDRPVHVEVRDGRKVVVKTYRHAGSGQVYADMVALWQSPFGGERRPPGLPQPLSVDQATGELVMTHVPGVALGKRGDLGDAGLRLREVAVLLADLHSSGTSVRRVRSAGRVLASSRRKVAGLGTDSAGPQAAVGSAAVAAAAARVIEMLADCCPVEEDLVPSHGDFSPRNVLGDATGVVLIDLDRLQMADPAHDLAYWGAWTWATEAMNHHVPSWEVLGRLQHHYHAYLGDGVLAVGGSLAFHQAVALLRIVHGWSALRALPTVQLVLLGEAARLLGR